MIASHKLWGAEMTMSVACTLSGVTKSFGRNRVLRGIDLSLNAGEVTVLMGANGAGKSTLVKILSGVHMADGGTMTLDGAPFAPTGAADAIALGVVTVHQSIDDGVIPDLDVASNLMLDRFTETGAGTFINDAKLRREASALAASMGLVVDVRTLVSSLGVADRQMIAIARAMARQPRLLILDEPTSSLSATEAARLFDLIERLRDQGVAILYISHRMSDIRRLADRIVAMRDGAVSGLFQTQPLDYEGAVQAMLGRAMTDVQITPASGGAPILGLSNLTLWTDSAPLTLTAHEGEVIAITGLLGSGKTALAGAIYGLNRPHGGTMMLDGAPYAPTSAGAAVRAGVHLSPKDRGQNAVIPAFDIADNMTLPFLRAFTTLGFLADRRQRRAADDMIETLGVVCQSNADAITALSGGNQQKVMIARWLLQPCRVLLLDEPFQGVDIGARRDIGAHIRATAKGRTTIVLVAEIDEALEIADRIIVLHDAAIAGENMNHNVDLAAVMAQVAGLAQTGVAA